MAGACAVDETSPPGAFNGIFETTLQYRPTYSMFRNRKLENESAAHIVPSLVNGARCKASTSTGDNSISPFWSTISRMVGQILAPLSGEKVWISAVATASDVLLSRITSNGARGERAAT